MDIKTQLTVLYNTLSTIETKGTNTETMADCLRYIRNMISAASEKAVAPDVPEEDAPKIESDT